MSKYNFGDLKVSDLNIDLKTLLNFDPTNKKGLIMFCCYVGIIALLFKRNGIALIFWSFALILFFNTKEDLKEPCRDSSIDNPYMNILQDNDGLKSCKVDDSVIKENFNHNLYRNETDLFDRKSMQAWYYKVEDKYPNDIRKFLKLLESNKRCKSDNVNCSYPSFFLN